jgi:hypothetical protein
MKSNSSTRLVAKITQMKYERISAFFFVFIFFLQPVGKAGMKSQVEKGKLFQNAL